MFSQPHHQKITNLNSFKSSIFSNNDSYYQPQNSNYSIQEIPSSNNLLFSSGSKVASKQETLAPILLSDSTVYQVKFKKGIRYFLRKPNDCREYKIEDVVIVEADRGEDLGVIKGIFTASMYCEARRQHSIRCGSCGVKEEEGSWDLNYLRRLASFDDLNSLALKSGDENVVVQKAREIAAVRFRLPIKIIDAEFQFDRKKLTVIYDTNSRVDFRDFVRELYSIFKIRIWMQQVDNSYQDNDDNQEDNVIPYDSTFISSNIYANSPVNRISPNSITSMVYNSRVMPAYSNQDSRFQF